MLNRRLLRTKAVQALYASQLAADANRLLGIDQLDVIFAPDLNSMLPQDRPKLTKLKGLAAKTFDELIKTGEPKEGEEVPVESLRAARDVYSVYKRQTLTDRDKMVRRVLNETELIHVDFIRVISLFIELAYQAQLDRQRTYEDPENPFPKNSGLDTNGVVKVLKEDAGLQDEIIRSGISWGNDLSVVRQTYKEALRKDEEYRNYCGKDTHTVDEDQQIVQHILRQILLKHETPLSYFEQRDLYWDDHYELIRGLAIKTLKTADSAETFQLAPLTKDWEEDREFVEELIRVVIEENDKYDAYLEDQLKNWDLERVAVVDLIILKTALAELIHFPGIPVKVTINEFIEIAKRYSTPKSGKFVNGVLDVLSDKLAKEGVIRKSGRGLIDNK